MNTIFHSLRGVMISILFVLLIITQSNFAQAPDTAWTKLYMPAGFLGMPAATVFQIGSSNARWWFYSCWYDDESLGKSLHC